MEKYDYLIVGAGLYGAVFAHEMKRAGKSCFVIEKRDHIAGNIYTENIAGINVHCYGAHIFHTNDIKVWKYICQFAEFNRFTNSPVANYKGEIYNLPFNMNTFNRMWGVITPEEAQKKIEEQRRSLGITEPKNLEEQAISLVGSDIYEKLIKDYTSKQWGRPCSELPAFIIKRLPVRFTYDNNYFNALYQGIPTALGSFFTRFAEKGIKPHPKTINVVHGYLFDDSTGVIKSILLKSAEFLTLPETDMILTMNRSDYHWAAKMFPKKLVQYIPGMGIDGQKLGKKGDIVAGSSEDLLLVYPAEFSKRKNQEMLIRAMPLLPESVKLMLPGDGALIDTCKALARELNVDKRVFFPGYVSNMGAVFSMADVAVSSSRSEGLPFHIMEAMLSGLPVIASDVKGNSDLVQHGITGYLFPYNDEKAFVRAVKELAEHRALIETMGLNARRYAEQFRIQQVLPVVMREYLRFEPL